MLLSRSTAVVLVAAEVAGGAGVVRVGAAGVCVRAGSRGRRSGREKEAQDGDGIGNDETPVVVKVLRFPA